MLKKLRYVDEEKDEAFSGLLKSYNYSWTHSALSSPVTLADLRKRVKQTMWQLQPHLISSTTVSEQPWQHP